MKKNKIRVRNQTSSCNKTFYGYGSKKPLDLMGSFESDLKIADKTENATFYVIADGTRDLLGKDTANMIRICVDMRRANTANLHENHPLPTMDKLLLKMKSAKYFSKLDIKDAFHQVELHPDSRYITTFITSKGLFRYKRLIFSFFFSFLEYPVPRKYF